MQISNSAMVKDQHGKDRELTHGQYGIYIRDHDRTLRANAFKQYHQQYASYENTMCELLTGQIQRIYSTLKPVDMLLAWILRFLFTTLTLPFITL